MIITCVINNPYHGLAFQNHHQHADQSVNFLSKETPLLIGELRKLPGRGVLSADPELLDWGR